MMTLFHFSFLSLFRPPVKIISSETDELSDTESLSQQDASVSLPKSGFDVGGVWSAGGPNRLPVDTTDGLKFFASSKKRVGTMSCSMTVCRWSRKISERETPSFLRNHEIMDSSNLEISFEWHRLKVSAWRVIEKGSFQFTLYLSFAESRFLCMQLLQSTPPKCHPTAGYTLWSNPPFFPHTYFFCNPFVYNTPAHIVPPHSYPPVHPTPFGNVLFTYIRTQRKKQ